MVFHGFFLGQLWPSDYNEYYNNDNDEDNDDDDEVTRVKRGGC